MPLPRLLRPRRLLPHISVSCVSSPYSRLPAHDGLARPHPISRDLARYQPLAAPRAAEWLKWLRRWLRAIEAEGGGAEGEHAGAAAVARMRRANPKYIPREWMLAEAYTGAEADNHTALHALEQLLLRPYDEQPEYEEDYYRQAPPGAAQQGGIGFMS